MNSVYILSVFGLILLVLSLVGSVFLFFYYLLLKREEKVKESWSQISVLYREEIELIPSLLRRVNEYTRREQETIASILSARTKAQELVAEIDGTIYPSEKKVRVAQETDGLMMSGLRKIDHLKKEYPLLQSDTHYLTIENKLLASQHGIEEARHHYNRVVEQYNHGLKAFPLNVITNLFHFEQKAYFTETN